MAARPRAGPARPCPGLPRPGPRRWAARWPGPRQGPGPLARAVLPEMTQAHRTGHPAPARAVRRSPAARRRGVPGSIRPGPVRYRQVAARRTPGPIRVRWPAPTGWFAARPRHPVPAGRPGSTRCRRWRGFLRPASTGFRLPRLRGSRRHPGPAGRRGSRNRPRPPGPGLRAPLRSRAAAPGRPGTGSRPATSSAPPARRAIPAARPG